MSSSEYLPPPSHLMWIGDFNSAYFKPCYQWCQHHFDAVTVRQSLEKALSRRCLDPTAIALVRDDSRHIDSHSLDDLLSRFPDATRFEFRSPVCEGFYRHRDRRFDGGMFRWSNAIHILRRHLFARNDEVDSPISEAIKPDPTGNDDGLKLVVATTYVRANAVMASLPSSGSIAFCRSISEAIGGQFCGVSRIYWDDSVFPTDRVDRWIKTPAKFDPSVHHTWMAMQPTPSVLELVRAHGIDEIVLKPGIWPMSQQPTKSRQILSGANQIVVGDRQFAA